LLPNLTAFDSQIQFPYVPAEITASFATDSDCDNLVLYANNTSTCVRVCKNGTVHTLATFNDYKIVSIPNPPLDPSIPALAISTKRDTLSIVQLTTGTVKWTFANYILGCATHGNQILYALSTARTTELGQAPVSLIAWRLDNQSLLWNMSISERQIFDEYPISITNNGNVLLSVGDSVLRISACNGRGKINGTTGNFTCACSQGWTGTICELAWCNSTSCGSNQLCSTNHLCVCEDAYFGPNCSTFCASNLTCSSRGYCNASNGVCVCDGMWQGGDCSAVWLQVTVFVMLGLIGLLAIVMTICMVKTACKANRPSGYAPISQQ